jgi:RNA polymerase sigma factor (sigma-70 family)
MEEADRNARLAQLTAEMTWLRALARALLRNDDAGDLAHDAWLIAAERGPTDDRPLRPWLTRVVLNLSRMQGRARRRREARESAASNADAVPNPEMLVERVELQRLIAGEVLQLDEPYRSTVLLHFFEELSCAEIARRCALPEGTVRRRLKVALDELRGRLDAKDAKSGRIALLAPLAGVPMSPRPGPIALGIVAMKKIVAAVVLLVLLLVGALLWRSHAGGQRSSSDAVSSTAQPTGALHQKGDGSPLSPPAWFMTSKAAPRKIAGRVTLNGAPVKDATVSLQSELTRAGYAAPIQLRTDARGAFDFGVQVAARYDIAASSLGTTAALISIDLGNPALKPQADRLELQLRDCSVSVSGIIYDASNNPLPKVSVKRLGDRYNVPSRGGIVGVESDPQGAYRICVPFGDTEVEYSADGFGSVILTIDARGEMYRDVALVPDASVSVRVVRADNGEPVANAQVFVSPSEWMDDRAAQRTGITDRDGRVRIEGFVPGRFQAWAYAQGLQARGPVEVLAEIGTSAEVVVKLDTMATITGKVVDGDKPVPAVRVIANRKSPIARTQPVFSQPDGSFVIDRVPAGDITFIASPYDVTSPAQLTVEAGKAYDVTLSVHSLGAIRGHVTRLGKPAADVDVCCIGTQLPPSVKTDADGKYEFLGVPAGKYPINAGSDVLGAFTLGTTVTLAAGEQRVLDLELDQAGTIAGTVVDREGTPVKGVFVRWINEKTGDLGRSITDTQGRYRCGAMTGGGKYRASVHPSSQLQAYPTANGDPYPTLDLKDGKTVIEGVILKIDRSQQSISGRVVDDTGSPIADALVKALQVSGGQMQFHSWMRLPMSSTDANGDFTIRGLLPGPYSLQARGANGAGL